MVIAYFIYLGISRKKSGKHIIRIVLISIHATK